MTDMRQPWEKAVSGVIGTTEVTIASGQSLSSAIVLDGRGIVMIEMPAAWTAASITFQVSLDGLAWHDLYDQTGEVAITTAAAGRTIILSPQTFYCFHFVRLRSGTAGAPVNQAADRVIAQVTRTF